MANFYVSATRGSDSTGTGTAASPWKTIGKAIGPSPAAALSGPTTIYVEPGVYYEGFTLGLAPTSAARLRIVGDCDGAGFAAGGYATPKTGIVEWAAWSDDATLRGVPCLAATSKSFVSLERIKFIGGQAFGALKGSCVSVVGGSDWTLRDCTFLPSETPGNANSAVSLVGAPGGGAMNHLVERCDLYSSPGYNLNCLDVAIYEQAAEYDANVAVRNCRIIPLSGNQGVGFNLRVAGGSGGKLARGVLVEHCTVLGNNYPLQFYAGVVGKPLATPNAARGCLIQGSQNGIVAGDATHVAEDYNVLNASTPRINVPVGAHSASNVRPSLDLGDGRLVGTPLRPYLEPVAGPLAQGRVPSGFPAVDLMNRARPEGLGSTSAACGALERHDTGEPDATFADVGSASCLALRGPGSLERPILVDPVPTTVRVKVRWDGGHGDAAKPRAVLLANPEVGLLADQVVTATSTGGVGSTPNAYETLTFAPFTPTRAGAVMLRLVSRSASGTGAAYFDSITLS